MTDADFRQLVKDMRLAKKKAERMASYVIHDGVGATQQRKALADASNEAMRLSEAVDRELGLMPSEV